MKKDISKLDPKEYILIKGAKLHNLKNIDLAIPKNKLVVITGMSGSGKSTLAFDTLYAEGQRRYVESLSSYARQFLGKLDKPQVDYIHGIAPAIAIQQKVNSTNPRSTVGTSTEIYDYLKLLYARIGKTFSPVTGELVKKDSVSDVIDFIKSYPFDSKFILAINLDIPEDRTFTEHLTILQQIGFTRLAIDGNQVKIEDLISFNFEPQPENKITLIIDRISVSEDAQDSFFHRLADSIETAFFEGKGNIELEIVDEKIVRTFSNKFEADGIIFNEPNTHFFSFNNPYGACPTCEGYGKVIGIDEDLVVPNKALSIYEDAIVAWKGDKMSEWKMHFMRLAPDFPIHKPYYELSDEQKDFLWRGAGEWEGLDGFFKMVEQNTYKIDRLKKECYFIPTEVFNMLQRSLQTCLILMVLFVACL